MTEEKQESKDKIPGRLRLSSRYWKTFFVILAAFLTFVGPTYIVYVSIRILEINYVISMFSGFVLFVAGLVLIWYLIRNKVIS
ncbi:MAG: hypothetical protein OEY22_01965 [Candidatus Bathyarchaeota archaeon]|nr:hypothetical protein [Candidatus Bathyarchaeota archaeon]MDH5788371.1 hypothetical protein [Candidatus Bathyarchaeota archaeon]